MYPFLAQLMCDSWRLGTLSGDDGVLFVAFSFYVCGLTHKRANYSTKDATDGK